LAGPTLPAGQLEELSFVFTPFLLSLALVAAAPGAKSPSASATAFPRFEWPALVIEEKVDLPDIIEANGVPVKLTVLVIRQPMDSLLQTFATSFERAGLWIHDSKRVFAEPHLTALDTVRLVSYSVVLSPMLDGTSTQVLLGEANLKSLTQPPANTFVLPKDATQVLQLRQEEADVASFHVPRPPAEAQRAQEAELGRLGFKPKVGEEKSGEFVRGKEQLRLFVRADGDGTSILMMRQRRGEGP
jgi:hypothetical protein